MNFPNASLSVGQSVTPMLYSVKDLRFSYRLGKQSVKALRGVSLEISRGKMVCLMGPSGSGKTTFLNVLGLVEPLKEGDVTLDGQSLRSLNEAERNRVRKFKIGFVFQAFHLFPVLSAEENVEYFLSRQKLSRGERRSRVEEALLAVDLWDQRKQKPLELSGGQRQRVAIARAIAKRPEVILADEPTASLDQSTGKQIVEILLRLNEAQKVTIILSSHDPMVQSFVHERVQLRDGLIVQAGGIDAH